MRAYCVGAAESNRVISADDLYSRTLILNFTAPIKFSSKIFRRVSLNCVSLGLTNFGPRHQWRTVQAARVLIPVLSFQR